MMRIIYSMCIYMFPLFNCDGCVSGWDVLIKRVQLTSVIPFINLHLYIHPNAYSYAPRHDPHDTPPSNNNDTTVNHTPTTIF
jgi:hypothetical protein